MKRKVNTEAEASELPHLHWIYYVIILEFIFQLFVLLLFVVAGQTIQWMYSWRWFIFSSINCFIIQILLCSSFEISLARSFFVSPKPVDALQRSLIWYRMKSSLIGANWKCENISSLRSSNVAFESYFFCFIWTRIILKLHHVSRCCYVYENVTWVTRDDLSLWDVKQFLGKRVSWTRGIFKSCSMSFVKKLKWNFLKSF